MKTLLRTLVPAFALVMAASQLQAGKVSQDLGSDSLVHISNGSATAYDSSELGDVKLYAIYYSAQWCPPCRKFTPELVQFYNRKKKNNPNFELIFVSSDRSEGDMERYMRDYSMKFPALKHDKRSIIKKHGGRGIPNLVIVDENNNVIKSSYEGENYIGPRAVLAELDKLLSKNKAAAAEGNDPNPFKNKEVNVFSR